MHADEGDSNQVWSFNAEKPIVGLTGWFDDTHINRLGFIMKDTACQDAIDGDDDDDTDDDSGDTDDNSGDSSGSGCDGGCETLDPLNPLNLPS